MSVAIAVDLGGTRVKLGAVDHTGSVIAREQSDAQPRAPFRIQLGAIAQKVERLVTRAGSDIQAVRGIAVGFPGVVDIVDQRILSTPKGKYEDAVGFDIAAWIHNKLGLDLVLENDARMALIGEWRHGAGRGTSDLVMVTLGSGLGTGVITGGRILRGAHGRGGILGGHITARYGGALCACGNRGCAEAEASTTALDRLITEIPDCASSRLRNGDFDYRDIVQLAGAGDPCAEQLIEHTLEVWTAFIVNLLHAYDPERVVLGGGISEHHPSLLDALRDSIDLVLAQVTWTPAEPVEIVPSALGDDAALLAAHVLFDEAGGHV